MNRCVLDASALVRVFFHTGDAPPEAVTVMAPSFLPVEFGNVLWKYIRGGFITEGEAFEVWEAFLGIGISLHDSKGLVPEALRFGASHGLTVYDSLYAVLAKREDATLVTADRKLFEKAGAAAIQALFLEPASA